MTVSARRTATSTPPIPGPRAAEPALASSGEVAPEATPEIPPAQVLWPEPWRSALGARPRTEYWDVMTASWRARGPRRD